MPPIRAVEWGLLALMAAMAGSALAFATFW